MDIHTYRPMDNLNVSATELTIIALNYMQQILPELITKKRVRILIGNNCYTFLGTCPTRWRNKFVKLILVTVSLCNKILCT